MQVIQNVQTLPSSLSPGCDSILRSSLFQQQHQCMPQPTRLIATAKIPKWGNLEPQMATKLSQSWSRELSESELMTKWQKVLKAILLVSGLFLITAFAATLLPVSSMAKAHEWLGLGEFPERPITAYLARSTSLLYSVHGVMMFYTGLTIQHHWRFAPIFGWLHILTGASVFLFDFFAPMPMYWLLLEGPPVAMLGILLLILARRAGSFEEQPIGLHEKTPSSTWTGVRSCWMIITKQASSLLAISS